MPPMVVQGRAAPCGTSLSPQDEMRPPPRACLALRPQPRALEERRGTSTPSQAAVVPGMEALQPFAEQYRQSKTSLLT